MSKKAEIPQNSQEVFWMRNTEADAGIGRDVEAGTVNVKDLASGEQESIAIDGVADHLDPSK